MKIPILPKYKTYIKLFAVFASLCFIFLNKESGIIINRNVEKIFRMTAGEIKPDTNVIILHITKNDFEKLGSYPLKRSYYALLINQLTSLNVKVIGLNVFLSDKLASQSIFNDVLNDEIQKSGKVVLSSILEGYDEKQKASLLIPEPKKELKSVVTGHTNYVEDNGIIIPLKWESEGKTEPAFSLALIEKEDKKDNIPASIKLNFISSWEEFRNYSLLEFFGLWENHDIELESFKDKIVLIGISDPEISGTFNTAYDNEMPGVALQAFALDNLLNNRYLRTSLLNISAITFILLVFSLALFKFKIRKLFLYIITSSVFIIFSFIFFIVFNYQLYYSFFIVPSILLITIEIVFTIFEKKEYLDGIINESVILRSTLEKKETELKKLQEEFETAGENSSQKLVEQIALLQEDIKKLKLKQIDEEKMETSPEDGKVANFFGLVYKSKAMSVVSELIIKVGPQDATILIIGESGTGKELAAKAVHEMNEKRKNQNFVAVNCAALTDTLLESELFGHVKGAFTGAISDKIGRFEAADKGTIFLDEIGETTENFQAKLLRVLQTGEFEKVGSSKTIRTDVRVIAATNKNLEQLVKEKKFREDLYYRLNVIKVELPPLRDRKEDIEAIACHFASREKMQLSKAVFDQLENYKWKGNVRELESVMKRAIIFAKAEKRSIIKLADLPEEIISKDKVELESLILESLREKKFSHSSITETARELGDISRTIVSENFRGIILKYFCELHFDMEGTVLKAAASKDPKIISKVKSKAETFLTNIEEGVEPIKILEFSEVKSKLNSKYKNLPQRFHIYLDEIIKYYQCR